MPICGPQFRENLLLECDGEFAIEQPRMCCVAVR